MGKRNREAEILEETETLGCRESKQRRCGEAEGCVMDRGMTGVMKGGTSDEERQMDHHDITLECVGTCVRAYSIFLLPPSYECVRTDDCIIRVYYGDYLFRVSRFTPLCINF